MSLFGRRLVDALGWDETPGVLAARWDGGGASIRHGAMLTVREGQQALLLHEGVLADQFGPGAYTLETGNLPLLSQLLEGGLGAGFATDVIFFAMRRQLDRRWGTPQPIAVRDADLGTLRLRAFGRMSYQIANPLLFQQQLLGQLPQLTVDEVEPQLRAAVVQALATRLGSGGTAFADLAANQAGLASALAAELAPVFAGMGLALVDFHIESLSVPDAVQAAIDTRAASTAGPTDASDILATIEKLHALHQAGALTEAEFAARKAALLAKLG